MTLLMPVVHLGVRMLRNVHTGYFGFGPKGTGVKMVFRLSEIRFISDYCGLDGRTSIRKEAMLLSKYYQSTIFVFKFVDPSKFY
jgi:hypothetical protein